jgi:hypothetical protein
VRSKPLASMRAPSAAAGSFRKSSSVSRPSRAHQATTSSANGNARMGNSPERAAASAASTQRMPVSSKSA